MSVLNGIIFLGKSFVTIALLFSEKFSLSGRQVHSLHSTYKHLNDRRY